MSSHLTCTFEDGRQAHLRHAVVDALVIKDNHILLVKRAEESLVEPGKYALPGGFMDQNESAKESIIREVLEETGYQTQDCQLFMLIDAPRLKGDSRQNVTLVHLITPSQKIQAPDHEIESTTWFPLDQLPQEIAFDHQDIIFTYQHWLKSKSPLPLQNFPPLHKS